MTSSLRRTVGCIVLALGAVAGPGLLASPQAGADPAPPVVTAATSAPDAPSPTPARAGKPDSVAAVGDSITQATGTGALSAETPANSWATGTAVNSIAARLGVATNKRFNLSANGDKMSDFAPQIQNGKSGGSGNVVPLPVDAGLVLVEFGGNDLCRDTVADMTPIETYRTQFKAGLAAVATKAPDALVQVLSVPDIYNLWYIRGAPQNATYHPESESGQASGINGARFYWDGLTWAGVKFPCQSLLTNPDSYASADRQRRSDVRTRAMAYNAVLAEECAKVLRCKFDDNRLFDLTSNRVSPPNGALLPQAQWAFTDLDISRNTASLCPIPGLVGSGCGDHFHPSKQGQGKIADSATIAGRDWTDTTFPTATATVVDSGRPGGVNRLQATVRFGATDAAGVRGQEVRIHRPDGSVTPWAPSPGIAPDAVIDEIGTSYAEVRSLDVNGNLSASTITPVTVLAADVPATPGTPAISATPAGLSLAWAPSADDGGSPVLRYEITPVSLTPTPVEGAVVTVAAGSSSADLPAPPPGLVVRYRVHAVNAVGASVASPESAPTVAPFASVADFVNQQHEDFTGAAPTIAVLDEDVNRLSTAIELPSALVDRLRASTWFDGAYGPATRLYRAYFLRIPDPSGLDYWATSRRNGRTLASISQQFSRSSEFSRRYGQLTNAQFIDKIYDNVFDRPPDPSGRAFYLARLNDGRWSRGEVVLQFSESSEHERKMRATVTVVELARGMNAKAPSPATVETLLATYETGGSAMVFQSIVAAETYRQRVLGVA